MNYYVECFATYFLVFSLNLQCGRMQTRRMISGWRMQDLLKGGFCDNIAREARAKFSEATPIFD